MSRAISGQPKHVFVRSYQACVPCRKRKVRCDLGDPGNPSDPPCQRCRREHKDCFFQDLRTNKGNNTPVKSETSNGNAIANPLSTTPPPKRQRLGKTATPPVPALPPLLPQLELEPLADVYRPPPLPPAHHPAAISPTESNTAERILHKEVHNANEALNLLYEAAAEGRPDDDSSSRADADGTKPRFSDTDNANTLAWRSFWCVRAGWMTDLEARCYVDFFFDNLNPLAPIISPALRDNHHILAKSEHALANTILTISARYYTLPGTGGASRSYAIHDRLWRYTRTLLGKLPFSAGRSVRRMGMVESLLLLTEWHPRNYHFPDDDPTEDYWLPPDNKAESSLEPAYRSDRMCWMLLANAVCLAYDIGIFDDDDDEFRSGAEIDDKDRKVRLQYLCYVYIHSFSARYGRGSALLPSHVTLNTERWINQHSLQPPVGSHGQDWRYIWAAVGLTKLMKNASEVLFASKRHTRELLRSGRYTSLLSHYEPVLQTLKQSLDQHPRMFSSSSLLMEAQFEQSKLMLLVEWEYIRLYINSLALQAVAERESSQSVIDGQTLQVSDEDAAYVDHVVDASKSILNYMIYSFAPRGYLQSSPVKTFLRIISAAVFLVKALALGRGAADLNTSFSLLDSTVEILRTTSIDDLHLANRFSILLESVLKHIRERFLPGQGIPDLSGADDLLGLSGEVTPGLLPFDASLAPFGVGVGKTWLGADGGGMEFLEWLMKGDDLNGLDST